MDINISVSFSLRYTLTVKLKKENIKKCVLKKMLLPFCTNLDALRCKSQLHNIYIVN